MEQVLLQPIKEGLVQLDIMWHLQQAIQVELVGVELGLQKMGVMVLCLVSLVLFIQVVQVVQVLVMVLQM